MTNLKRGDLANIKKIKIKTKNDKYEVLRRKFLEEKQKREDSRKKDQKKVTDTDEYDNPFAGWDFDYYD